MPPKSETPTDFKLLTFIHYKLSTKLEDTRFRKFGDIVTKLETSHATWNNNMLKLWADGPRLDSDFPNDTKVATETRREFDTAMKAYENFISKVAGDLEMWNSLFEKDPCKPASNLEPVSSWD